MIRIVVFFAAAALLALFTKVGFNKDALAMIALIGGALAIPAMLLFLGVMWIMEQRRTNKTARLAASKDPINRGIAQAALAPKLRAAIAGGNLKFVDKIGAADRKGMWAAFTADADGNTPDHLAAANGHAAMIEKLASMGLAVIDRNNAGKTMLDVAPPAHAAAIKAAFCRGYAQHLLRTKWKLDTPAADQRAVEEWIDDIAERRHTMTSRQISFDASEEDCAGGLIRHAAAAVDAGDVERARRNVDLAMRLSSKTGAESAPEFLARSSAASRDGAFDRALQYADLAVRLAPNLPNALARRGTALADTGDDRHALEDYNEVLRLVPADAQFYEWRAVVHEKLGDTTSAMKDYEKALELDPSRTRAQERYNALIASA